MESSGRVYEGGSDDLLYTPPRHPSIVKKWNTVSIEHHIKSIYIYFRSLMLLLSKIACSSRPHLGQMPLLVSPTVWRSPTSLRLIVLNQPGSWFKRPLSLLISSRSSTSTYWPHSIHSTMSWLLMETNRSLVDNQPNPSNWTQDLTLLRDSEISHTPSSNSQLKVSSWIN